jgi:hypothetical protein
MNLLNSLVATYRSGRTTFISRFNDAKKNKSKVGTCCVPGVAFLSSNALAPDRKLTFAVFVGALKAEIFPLTLYTSAGTVLLNVYDSTLHAKGKPSA